MHFRVSQRAVRVTVLMFALALSVAGAVAPASADPIPGYCVGANEPPIGWAEVCTP